MNEANSKLEPITWDEIKDFYKQNFNETLPENYEKSFCYAWSKSRKMPVIDLLATGYRAAEQQAKIDFAAKYDHKSPLQVIAAEYVKRRGTIGPLAVLEENRFIDGYEAGLHASGHQWINVKDKLPEINQGFIGFVENKEVCNCYRYPDSSSDGSPVFYARSKLGLLIGGLESISHWQPLPKPPEEE